jgi:predicted Zn-dependent protease
MGNKNFFREECVFFDNGRVASGIKQMQNDYMAIGKEIAYLKEDGAEKTGNKEKIKELLTRQYEILQVMCFQGSQNFNNIGNCIKWMGNFKNDFLECLYGLQAYADGNHEEAFDRLKGYSEQHKGFGDHYLLNLVFGELLLERNNYKLAEFYLKNAVLLCPESVDAHIKLMEVYQVVGNIAGVDTEEKIVELLRCNVC